MTFVFQNLKSPIFLGSLLISFSLQSTLANGAEFRPITESPQCELGPANFNPYLVPQRVWNWELVAALEKAPTIWVERVGGELRVGLHAAAHITYWTCPPDGDSVETSIHKPFIAIFDDQKSAEGKLSRIGYTPVDLYHPQIIQLDPTVDVIDDMNDYYDEIDGSGADLEYRGPGDELDLVFPQAFDPTIDTELTVTFPDACGAGKPLQVSYRKHLE